MEEQYIVSALKYRPQDFDTVVGQMHITTTLKNAIRTNHLAHSFLFCGPRGVGKTTCARILAKTINCDNKTAEGEACDVCPACTSFNNNTSFSVYELDAASNNSVDDIRDLVEQVRFAPQAGKYKVYIIDEVHMLSNQAFNAFLKTLEEPPAHAIFILATTEKHKIIPTILSRCQIFEFKRIGTDDIIEHLQGICTKENISSEREALHLIAQKSEGCMRDALSIMDKLAGFSSNNISYNATIEHLNILDYDYYFKMIESLLIQDLTSILLLIDEVLAKGFEADMILNGLAEHFRNLLICENAQLVKLMDLPEGIKAKYYHQATQCNKNFILNALSIIGQTELNIKQARNKRLMLEMAFIKINYLQDAIHLLQNDDALVKKKLITEEEKTVLHFKKSTPILLIDNTIKISSIENNTSELKNSVAEEPEKFIPKTSQETEIKMPQQAAGINFNKGMFDIKKLKEKHSQSINEQIVQEIIPLNDEKIKTIWEKFYTSHTTLKPLFRVAMSECELTFKENQLDIFCDKTILDFVNGLRHDMLEAFKNGFCNEALNVIIKEKIITTSSSATVSKSKKEIFEMLALKNPLLDDLRNKLGLELEY